MAWEDLVHKAIAGAEVFAQHLKTGIEALDKNPDVEALVEKVPLLAPYVEKLAGFATGLGEAGTALELVDLIVDAAPALTALGGVVQFAPADVKTFAGWQDPTDPGARQE